jgi:hypothetical protein
MTVHHTESMRMLHLDDGGSKHLSNVGQFLTVYRTQHPITQVSNEGVHVKNKYSLPMFVIARKLSLFSACKCAVR